MIFFPFCLAVYFCHQSIWLLLEGLNKQQHLIILFLKGSLFHILSYLPLKQVSDIGSNIIPVLWMRKLDIVNCSRARSLDFIIMRHLWYANGRTRWPGKGLWRLSTPPPQFTDQGWDPERKKDLSETHGFWARTSSQHIILLSEAGVRMQGRDLALCLPEALTLSVILSPKDRGESVLKYNSEYIFFFTLINGLCCQNQIA